MGHRKLKKFAENETFGCLLQPDTSELLSDGYSALKDDPVKGHWNERVFDAPRPIIVEFGCGRGEYTIDLARRNPQFNYIGVDIKGARLWKGAKEATECGMGNVAFLRTRIEFITAFFAPAEVSGLWLTFSDPQMKSENKRLTSPVFLAKYANFLAPDGRIRLKTDSRFLHEYTKAVVKANDLPLHACTADLYANTGEFDEPALYEVQTFYEKMFMAQGYKITYLEFSLEGKNAFVNPEDPEEFDSEYWRSVEGPRQFLHQLTRK